MIFASVVLLCSQVIWFQTTFGHILRLHCMTFGNFSISKPGQKQTGYVLTNLTNFGEDECEKQCINHRLCKSINFNNHTCELSSKSTEDPFDNVQLSRVTGWTYKSTDYKEINIGYYCQEAKPCPVGVQCTDSCNYPGYQCHITSYGGFQSCKEAYNSGIRETGVVPMYLSGLNTFYVRCDMVTDNGGWIVFQRRVDATVDFNRGWDDYKAGFGDPNGNFWLGLERIHRLAGPGKGAKLRIDLKHETYYWVNYYAVYTTFEISNEADGYRIKVGGFSGNAGDSLTYHNGMKFSTKDQDNDLEPNNCAWYFEGAWWFNSCYLSYLNGHHPSAAKTYEKKKYISWKAFNNQNGEWTMTEMKFRI